MNNEITNNDEFYTLPSALNEIEPDQIYVPELENFEILESGINTMTIKIVNPIKKPKIIDLPIEIPEPKKRKSNI